MLYIVTLDEVKLYQANIAKAETIGAQLNLCLLSLTN